MPETQGETIIDQIFNLLQQIIIPNWSDLILLLPWVLIALVLLYLAHTALQWRRAGARNQTRVPLRLAGGAPPPGVHVAAPSRWPFVVPIGAFLLLLSFVIPPRDAAGNQTLPFSPMILIAGLVVTVIAVSGWLLEAMREWRSTVQSDPGHADVGHAQLSAATAAAALPAGGGAMILTPTSAVVAAEAPVHREPPPGVHMPGPSPWPFLAPISFFVILLGVIFSAVLIVGGIVLAVISAAGWLMEAGHEYRTTEELGHAVPATRDPVAAWPKRLVPIFAGVIAVSLLITLAPIGLTYLNSLTPPSAGPTAVAVPAVPEISASTAVSFETGTLIVPAGRPFDLVFNNKQAGVPHNVQIADSSARTQVLFDGEVVTGADSVTYNVPAIPEGDYYFLCKIHPNMNGQLLSRPESGGSPGGPAQPGQPRSGESPAP